MSSTVRAYVSKDFRSRDGLYDRLKKEHPKAISKGQDLFDYHLFRDENLTSLFYKFVAELREMIKNASATRVHEFIKKLDDRKQLLRCYTQNIDCLELRMKMSCDMDDLETLRVVQLHGDLEHVVCNMCMTVYEFHDDLCREFSLGKPPMCPNCFEWDQVREAAGKRKVTIGTLMPNIVLYNEVHKRGEQIAGLASRDAKMRPDMLLVLGTSLRVDGIKKLVKFLAKVVQGHKNGCVVFINSIEIGSRREWSNVFDYHILGDASIAVAEIENSISRLNCERKPRPPTVPRASHPPAHKRYKSLIPEDRSLTSKSRTNRCSRS